MAAVECINLTARFKNWEGIFNSKFGEGEWHVLCGASGSGKSTLFQLMLGLMRADAGILMINGINAINVPPHKRSMTFMAQYNLLLPHLTILENLDLALHDSGKSRQEKSEKIDHMIALLKLESHHLAQRPNELSGGQLSRFNLARSLLRPARWLLLDEPFAAVDRPTRLSILEWLRKWQQQTGAGILLVSHDLDDIFNVASHVTVLNDGRLLESQALSDAIQSPQHVTTATLLRAGIVIKNNQKSQFISSSHLALHPEEITCDPNFLDVIHLNNARDIRIGNSLRIIELATATDITLPASRCFTGSLWFDRRNIKLIKNS
jgi:ABC-type sugar transport system ATPase subunit